MPAVCFGIKNQPSHDFPSSAIRTLIYRHFVLIVITQEPFAGSTKKACAGNCFLKVKISLPLKQSDPKLVLFDFSFQLNVHCAVA